jgi:flagellar motor switch protein FliM
MMNLCIPFNAIERIGGKLTTNSWVSYSAGLCHGRSRSSTSVGSLEGALVELVATLARAASRRADLLGLRVGDIVTTEKDVHSLLEVAVEGVAKFHAFPGALKGHKAIQ